MAVSYRASINNKREVVAKKRIPSDENVLVFTPVDCSVIDH